MACMKLGSKADSFQRQGQTWFCNTGLPSDVIVKVDPMSFHLHKFPLLSRSGRMERLISEASSQSSEQEEGKCVIDLSDIPGGSRTFELIAKFCYGVKLELTASNFIPLRCAAENLIMTDDYGEGNLIARTETFLNQTVLKNWRDSLRVLQSCGDEDILPYADMLNITDRCIMSLATKALTDPNIFGWPVVELGGPSQSPGGSLLWNGISTGARPSNLSCSWWYEDALGLSLPIYKRLIKAMESRGIRPEVIAGSVVSYARHYLPGLNRHQDSRNSKLDHRPGLVTSLPEEAQKDLLEEIDRLLPTQKGLVPTKFLCGLLRTAIILKANPSCISDLEKRVGAQLDQATLDDLLIPAFSHSTETLYDVDCVQRILEHFLASVKPTGDLQASPHVDDEEDYHGISSPAPLTPVTKVAKLIDGYLAEVASDVNFKLPKFQAVAAAVPEDARLFDDGLYRAIDIYLKSHPWLSESEREELCRLIECQKLSIEACTHAAQNERLPLRTIVQVLFFEQLQLKTSIAGCLLVSDNLDQSRPLRSGPIPGAAEGAWATAVRENQVLRVGMDSMKMRVSELEKMCDSMKQEIEKLGGAKNNSYDDTGNGTGGGRTWGSITKKLGFKAKSQMCSEQQSKGKAKIEKVKEQHNGVRRQSKRLSPER